MSALNTKKLTRLMKRAESEMGPYLDTFCSPEGMLAVLPISGAAALVAEGAESKKYLKLVTIKASKLSGIPLKAMTAHAECSLAMYRQSIQMQRPTPFIGGDENE
jgi:hypothetical protein